MTNYKVYVGVELGYCVSVEANNRKDAVTIATHLVENNDYPQDDCELTSISTCELWTEIKE